MLNSFGGQPIFSSSWNRPLLGQVDEGNVEGQFTCYTPIFMLSVLLCL